MAQCSRASGNCSTTPSESTPLILIKLYKRKKHEFSWRVSWFVQMTLIVMHRGLYSCSMFEHRGYCWSTLSFAGGIISDLGYGHHINSLDDEFFAVGERFLKVGTFATTPTLLDLHPLCEYRSQFFPYIIWLINIVGYLPSWAPGAWFVKFIKGLCIMQYWFTSEGRISVTIITQTQCLSWMLLWMTALTKSWRRS